MRNLVAGLALENLVTGLPPQLTFPESSTIFPGPWYLRSTAIWNFDLARGNFAIPIGFGAGKLWILHSGAVVTPFAEPQVTIAHSGPGRLQFQIFAGSNLQFPIHWK